MPILQNKPNLALSHIQLGFRRYFYVVKD